MHRLISKAGPVNMWFWLFQKICKSNVCCYASIHDDSGNGIVRFPVPLLKACCNPPWTISVTLLESQDEEEDRLMRVCRADSVLAVICRGVGLQPTALQGSRRAKASLSPPPQAAVVQARGRGVPALKALWGHPRPVMQSSRGA